MAEGLESDSSDLKGLSAWDFAHRYHELKGRPKYRPRIQEIQSLAIFAILKRARNILGSIAHPTISRAAPFSGIPKSADCIEFDLEETLENWTIPSFTTKNNTFEELWYTFRQKKSKYLILTVDTSLSMTGVKLALTAVALAIVLLYFPKDPIGIVAFENTATVLKYPDEIITIEEMIKRFLEVPAQGYTHLETGLQKTLSMITSIENQKEKKSATVILMTDGKYTAGRNPSYLASRFDHLLVLGLGDDLSGQNLCKTLAHRGHGKFNKVSELHQLPLAMFYTIKNLFRRN